MCIKCKSFRVKWHLRPTTFMMKKKYQILQREKIARRGDRIIPPDGLHHCQQMLKDDLKKYHLNMYHGECVKLRNTHTHHHWFWLFFYLSVAHLKNSKNMFGIFWCVENKFQILYGACIFVVFMLRNEASEWLQLFLLRLGIASHTSPETPTDSIYF